MRYLLILFFLLLSVYAERLDILADSFERNQNKNFSSFSGNVRIKKGSDELNASKVLVYVDDENHPVKYQAFGDVSFHITTEDNTSYNGRSQELVFLPLTQEYQFYRKVYIEESGSSRTLSGEKIVLNMTTGNAKIKGKEKLPVRVTFELDDNNGTKKGLNNETPVSEKPEAEETNTSKRLDDNKSQKNSSLGGL